MQKWISESFETERLIISEAAHSDLMRLEAICKSWEDKTWIEGEAFPDEYIESCLEKGDLPPSPLATKENYRLKKIVMKDSDEIIGYFDLYYGFPSEDCIYMSIFLIDSKYQKMHHAKEVVTQLIAEGKRTSYKKLSIGVQLKNWKALKFWINSGFKSIRGYYGDSILSDSTFAILGLEVDL